MKTGEHPIGEQGRWRVVQVTRDARMTWVSGLVREGDAKQLAAQANQMAKSRGKANTRYEIEETTEDAEWN